jgi:spore germination protein
MKSYNSAEIAKIKNSKVKNTLLVLIPILLLGLIILAIYKIDKGNQDSNSTEKTEIQEVDVDNEALSPAQTQNWLNEEPEQTEITVQDAETTDMDITPKISNLPVAQSAWLPSWAQSTGMKSISQPYTQFTYIMPVWYSVETNGNLINRKPAGYNDLFTLANNRGFKIIPSIGMFDADILSQILEGNSLDNHVNQIILELNKHNYAGIDIDYEMTYLADKARWELFILKLSTALQNNNKILSVTVLPKWGDNVVYTGLKETREVQDWAYLDQHVDQLRIMTYNYTSTGASTAGPIGPIDWQEDVIQYALTKVERNKIWLGVHLYGFVWNENGYVKSTIAEDIPSILETATFQQYSDIIEEGYAEYPCGTNNTLHCKVYYQTEEGVQARYDLAQSYGIGGLAYWRLGQDMDLLDLTD